MLDVRIPEERKAVLIGRKAAVKRRIEAALGVRLTVGDSVLIDGDPVASMAAKDVVTAIGRGFAPDKAVKLADEKYALEVIDLKEWFDSERKLRTLRGRIIGSGGKAKKIIEQSTKTFISVYGNTVAIIGEWDGLERAKDAIGLLIRGKTHSSAYKLLRKAGAEQNPRQISPELEVHSGKDNK